MSDSVARPVSTDRDPADQLVAVEITRGSWETIIGILSGGGAVSSRLAGMIESRIPAPPLSFPTGLGSVIRATRTVNGNLLEMVLVRVTEDNREPTYIHWRDVDVVEARFYPEQDLTVTEVLAEGIHL